MDLSAGHAVSIGDFRVLVRLDDSGNRAATWVGYGGTVDQRRVLLRSLQQITGGQDILN